MSWHHLIPCHWLKVLALQHHKFRLFKSDSFIRMELV
jgi:hypothetical protein